VYDDAVMAPGPHDNVPDTNFINPDRNDLNDIVIPDEWRHTSTGHFELDRHPLAQEVQNQGLDQHWGRDLRGHPITHWPFQKPRRTTARPL